jgi:MFS family permease
MMTAQERLSVKGLASLYALRMLGLFLVLPFLALHARDMTGSTGWLVGLAMAAYGLTQAIFQLPLGILADKVGRKPIIVFGLVLFAIGGAVAGWASNHDALYGLILGRALQGAGAMSAAVTALLADQTSEENRTKAMGAIGMTIGLTFAVSLAIGASLDTWLGTGGVFYLTALLSILGIGVILFYVPPAPPLPRSSQHHLKSRLARVIAHRELLRLNYGIFALHAAQMAMFSMVPFLLVDQLQLVKSAHWQIYVPSVMVGFVFMIPIIIFSEKKRCLKSVFMAAIGLIAVAQALLGLMHHSLWSFLFSMSLYFIAFNVLEATLPSLVSKIAPIDAKATAMGVYNTAQSLGLFAGGLIGGIGYIYYGSLGVTCVSVLLLLSWLFLAVNMITPPPVRTIFRPLPPHYVNQLAFYTEKILAVDGVKELSFNLDKTEIQLKVLQDGYDEASLKALLLP